MENMPQLHRLEVSESPLDLDGVRALQPALQANRTLRILWLPYCRIRDEGISLIADALVGNTIMEVLDIGGNEITSNGLDNITRMIQSMHLKTIGLIENLDIFDDADSTRQFAHILSRHGFLNDLYLAGCGLGDAGIHIIANALVGNTIMETVDISQNSVTSIGLADIKHLLESTMLKTITFSGNPDIFREAVATQHFVATLHHKKSNVQELPGITQSAFPGDEDSKTAVFFSINNSLIRNQQLNRLDLLLAVPPLPLTPTQQHPPLNAAISGTMMLKIWHKAIAKFATIPNHAGTSAIFHLLQARPQLLEKRLKRPATATTTASTVDSHKQKHPRL